MQTKIDMNELQEHNPETLQQETRLASLCTLLAESYASKEIIQKTVLHFNAEQSLTAKFALVLREILAVHAVDMSMWGKGRNKSFTEFVDDAQKGERLLYLHNDELIARVERVRVGVFYHNEAGWWMLHDGIQVYDELDQEGNPRIRDRDILGLREKIQPHERKNVKKAILRMISEESGRQLHITDPERIILIECKPKDPEKEKRLRPSKTFPGLTSDAVLHKGFIIITNDDFVVGKSFGACQLFPTQFYFPGGKSREGFQEGTRGFIEVQKEGKREEHKTCYVAWEKVAEGDLPDYFMKYLKQQNLRRSVRNL